MSLAIIATGITCFLAGVSTGVQIGRIAEREAIRRRFARVLGHREHRDQA